MLQNEAELLQQEQEGTSKLGVLSSPLNRRRSAIDGLSTALAFFPFLRSGISFLVVSENSFDDRDEDGKWQEPRHNGAWLS